MLKEFNESVQKTDEILSSTNVAEMLSKEELDKIGIDVVEGYEIDRRSRSDWETKYDNSLKLAAQVFEPKSFPWPGAANIKYPLLTTACLQFSSRAYPVLVPPVDPVKCRVVGYDETGEKTRRSERISKHMSYQVLEEMEEWEEDMDRLLVMLPITGTEFKKSYFDPTKGRNVSCHVMPKDLVVNYWAKTLESAPRKTHVFQLSKNEVKERMLRGIFLEQDIGTPVQETDPLRIVSDGIQGLTPDENPPHTLLEQHCWRDLDDDGYDEPYVITVEKDSKKVLRIAARYLTDSVQRDGKKIISITPVEYFTKFSFIPSIDGGFYDTGFGSLLGPINETVNTTINQLLDAGTLASLQTGFLARGIRLKSGEKKLRPGEWLPVESNFDDLRKGIFPLQFQPPSQVLFQLLGMMVSAGEKMGSITDLRVGESPGQNQPATTTLAVLEQGAKVETAINKRLWRALKNEYKKLYELNRIYLDDEAYFSVIDPSKEDAGTIERSDYDGDPNDVVPSGDPSAGSEMMRLKQAEAGVASLKEGSPANPLEIWERYYRAIGYHSIGSLLPKEMPKPPPDPKLITAQSEVLRAKYETANAKQQTENDRSKLVFDGAIAAATVLNLKADTILKIAKAESEEKGQQMDQYQMVLDRFSEKEQQVENEVQRRHELMMAQEEPPMPDDSPIEPTEVTNDEGRLPALEGITGDAGDIQDTEGYEATVPGTNAGSGRRPYPAGETGGDY